LGKKKIVVNNKTNELIVLLLSREQLAQFGYHFGWDLVNFAYDVSSANY
jgi:hypothetical protein